MSYRQDTENEIENQGQTLAATNRADYQYYTLRYSEMGTIKQLNAPVVTMGVFNSPLYGLLRRNIWKIGKKPLKLIKGISLNSHTVVRKFF